MDFVKIFASFINFPIEVRYNRHCSTNTRIHRQFRINLLNNQLDDTKYQNKFQNQYAQFFFYRSNSFILRIELELCEIDLFDIEPLVWVSMTKTLTKRHQMRERKKMEKQAKQPKNTKMKRVAIIWITNLHALNHLISAFYEGKQSIYHVSNGNIYKHRWILITYEYIW